MAERLRYRLQSGSPQFDSGRHLQLTERIIMKITLEMYDTICSIETEGDDLDECEIKDLFSRLMVVAGYPASVIEERGGRWGWIED